MSKILYFSQELFVNRHLSQFLEKRGSILVSGIFPFLLKQDNSLCVPKVDSFSSSVYNKYVEGK